MLCLNVCVLENFVWFLLYVALDFLSKTFFSSLFYRFSSWECVCICLSYFYFVFPEVCTATNMLYVFFRKKLILYAVCQTDHLMVFEAFGMFFFLYWHWILYNLVFWFHAFNFFFCYLWFSILSFLFIIYVWLMAILGK